jgi:hypothetical protein
MRGKLELAQVVDQTVPQVVFPVGIAFIVVTITLVTDFILLKHGDLWGENRGNSAER